MGIKSRWLSPPRVVILTALSVGSLLALASASSAEAPPVHGNFTYAEARANGIPTLPTPDQLGLPACHPDPNWKGFSSAAEAEQAVPAAENAPECAADPTQVIYSVGFPAPEPTPPAAPSGTSGHRYAGAQNQ